MNKKSMIDPLTIMIITLILFILLVILWEMRVISIIDIFKGNFECNVIKPT